MSNKNEATEFIKIDETNLDETHDSDETQPTLSKSKRLRIIIPIICLSLILIAASAYAIVGSGSHDGVDGANQSKIEASDSNKKKDEATDKDKASEDKSNEASQQEGGGVQASGGESGTSGSSSSAAVSSGGSEVSQGDTDTVTVTVNVSSSAVGNPVSASSTVTLEKGATVYDALCAAGVSINSISTGYGVYVTAIGGLAEKEHGATSGWTFYVNGVFADSSCSSCVLSDGDTVSWEYVTG